MKFLISLAFLLFSLSMPLLLTAQGITETVDPKVEKLMQRFIAENENTQSVKGWRIQIMATNDRQRMESVLSQFEFLYPNIPADWIHTKPYYKIRVGAFTTKREALRTLYILKEDYPGAYPVQDANIKPEELLH